MQANIFKLLIFILFQVRRAIGYKDSIYFCVLKVFLKNFINFFFISN